MGAHARSTPDAAAIVSPRRQLTFEELDRRQRALAGALRSAGLRDRDRIAVLSTNRPEVLEVTIGALRSAVVPVPVNPLLTPPEIAYVLADSGARWLFTDRPFTARPPLERVVVFGDDYEQLLRSEGRAEVASFTRGRPMHYTSGTTGRPKGVWVEPYDEPVAARVSQRFRKLWELSSDDVHLVCSPLAHSAPHRFALRTLEAGGTVILPGWFDAEATLPAIELFGVTTTFMVPTHLERIFALGERSLARHDLSSMRLLVHAGAPIRDATKRKAIELFPPGSVWEFYGSTEGQATRISTDEWVRKPGSVGRPTPGTTVRIIDDKGLELDRGEIGEVWIEGPSEERFEYWGDASKTRSAWQRSAFSVGDLGWLDEDGYLFLSGRKHDTIITGGVNVYPQEVEQALLEHPAVREVVVYGAPHDEWGEEVRARLVPVAGKNVDVDALREWARERLAGFKCPRRFEVVDELPRTATGKVKREC